MPWKEVKPMDQKILFIADYLRGISTFSALCLDYCISRKTGYKWLNRYQHLGIEGLQDKSRHPYSCPHQIPHRVRMAIIETRKAGRITPGPKKIKILLGQKYPAWEIPSETSIYNILKKEGVIAAKKHRRHVAPATQPFSPVHEANDLWSADFKGQFKTKDGAWCYPLTVMDHKSRFLLGCRGFDGTKFEQTQEAFKGLFREYGLPWRIRTDNGVPFASTSPGGLSRLAMWWIRLGIVPERIAPGKPQQNGRHERMHKTLKEATALPPAQTAGLQQKAFDHFRHEYNYKRPHESLGQKPPATGYIPSSRPMPNKLPELIYPEHFKTAHVNPNGVIYHEGHRVYVAGLLQREIVGLKETADGIWDVYYGPVKLGCFNMRNKQIRRNDYIKLNV